MAWAATDNFDTYSTGQLNGNNGGSGWTEAWGATSGNNGVTVSTTTSYSGTKSATGGTGDIATDRYFATISSGTVIVYFALRRAGTAGSSPMSLSFRAGTPGATDQNRIRVNLDTDGNIKLIGSTTVTVAAYSANTWYSFRLTINMDAGTAVLAYSTDAYGSAGTFSADSSSVTLGSSGSLTHVEPQFGTVTSYVDAISSTSPFLINYTLALAVGAFTLSGIAATLKRALVLAGATGSLTFAGIAASLKRALVFSGAIGTFTYSVTDAVFHKGFAFVLDTGDFVLTGTTATLIRALRMIASTGSFTFSGISAALVKAVTLAGDTAAFTYSVTDAALRRTHIIVAAVGSFTITGYSAIVARTYFLVAAVGSFTLTGVSAAFKRALRLVAATRTFTLSGAISRVRTYWLKHERAFSAWVDKTRSTSNWTNKDRI